MGNPRFTMDRTSQLRLQTGFPVNAGRLMQLVHFLALAAMLLWRPWLGARIVGVFRIAGMLICLLLWSLLIGACVAGSNEARFRLMVSWSVAAACALTCIGLAKRLTRWIKLQRGEQLHTLSLGLSPFAKGRIPNANAERYLDPLATVALGLALCLPAVASSLLCASGSWLVASGVALYFVEKYVQDLQLDRADAMLASEAHEQLTASYLKTLDAAAKRPVSNLPVSTGVAADVTASIQRRQRRTALPVPGDATQAAVDMNSGGSAVIGVGPAVLSADQLPTADLRPEAGPSLIDGPPEATLPATRTSARHSVLFPLLEKPRARGLPNGYPSLFWAGFLLFAASVYFAASSWENAARRDQRTAPQREIALPRAAGLASESASIDATRASELYERARDVREGRNNAVKDAGQGVQLLRDAAVLGDARAQFELGRLYETGTSGLTGDCAEAAAWYVASSRQGHRQALYRLAKMHVPLPRTYRTHATYQASVVEAEMALDFFFGNDVRVPLTP